MKNILEQLADHARKRVAEDKTAVSVSDVLSKLDTYLGSDSRRIPFIFENTLKQDGLSFICEVKKASPSKGIIDPEFNYKQIALEYTSAGADCISCLTEPKWFLGSDSVFREIRDITQVPMIRKDFTVDEYQIYQSKLMGADAVLLICSILTEAELRHFLDLSHELGLSALVETHDAEEMKLAASLGAQLIGVNNRDLKTFEIDIENSLKLKELAPENAVFVSESGIRGPEDIAPLSQLGVDAVLIGETLMRSADKKEMLDKLRSASGFHPVRNITEKAAEDTAGSSAKYPANINVSANEVSFPGSAALSSDVSTRIKCCGLRRPEDIEAVNSINADFAGFIMSDRFWRYVEPEKVAELSSMLNPGIQAVGVFVDEPAEYVARQIIDKTIDIAQLHGSEDDAYIEKLRAILAEHGILAAAQQKGYGDNTPNTTGHAEGGSASGTAGDTESLHAKPPRGSIIKAFKIKSSEDIKRAEHSTADYILLDSGTGTGVTFDWSLMTSIKRPYFFAGGLEPGNAAEAVRRFRPYAVDVSSGIETDKIKDAVKIKAFAENVRAAAR